MLGIEGRSLHSYRYAWAQRARAAGMPEREAMNHLGHESRAIHAAYAGGATVATLPLEFYEAQNRRTLCSSRQRHRDTAEPPRASNPNRPIKATAGGGLEAKRCRMADNADLNWPSEIANLPALCQWRRGQHRCTKWWRSRRQIDLLFKLESQTVNLGKILSTKARDARFRNNHAVLCEQSLNLRERSILGSQCEHC